MLLDSNFYHLKYGKNGSYISSRLCMVHQHTVGMNMIAKGNVQH